MLVGVISSVLILPFQKKGFMTEEDVKRRISSVFNDAKIQIIDTTGTGDHFSAVIISDKFDGKSLVQRHQMVYGSVSDVLTGELHALQLKTFTFKEWKKRQ